MIYDLWNLARHQMGADSQRATNRRSSRGSQVARLALPEPQGFHQVRQCVSSASYPIPMLYKYLRRALDTKNHVHIVVSIDKFVSLQCSLQHSLQANEP